MVWGSRPVEKFPTLSSRYMMRYSMMPAFDFVASGLFLQEKDPTRMMHTIRYLRKEKLTVKILNVCKDNNII